VRVHRGTFAVLITGIVLANAPFARARDATSTNLPEHWIPAMAQSTGDAMLDKVSTNMFRRWRFKPGTMSQVRVPVDYE
jgi:hypothetical protein